MSKYKITVTRTGHDYKETRGWLSTTKTGTFAEMIVEANDPEVAKSIASEILGNRVASLEAQKL
ncbi:hypothetical protein [Nostoc sp. ChiSLP03a]|uniref:hypothetical protein n=1 Tax=Nostoc sp. ChiSLP03a TaxID=3075380 RepID=UPI002AD3B258|nr:hypothetical protein [Nostoc sp. ChiSLP03a]MDZ8210852.1 hypothetical protein [Nostoc sp. ChiSLP03a]